jgi:hypothetical protein
MKKRVYIETTVVSLLTARPTRDLIQAAFQQVTLDWWNKRSHAFALYVSELVIAEAAGGDEEAASRRLSVVQGLPVLGANPDVEALATALVAGGQIPPKASDDAIHLALAAVHGMDFLLTWNCRHLANGERMGGLGEVVMAHGFRPPIICTPEQLLGDIADTGKTGDER